MKSVFKCANAEKKADKNGIFRKKMRQLKYESWAMTVISWIFFMILPLWVTAEQEIWAPKGDLINKRKSS